MNCNLQARSPLPLRASTPVLSHLIFWKQSCKSTRCGELCDLECVGTVAKIDDEVIVRDVDLNAAVQQAHHRHVFQPQRLLLCATSGSSCALVRGPTAAAVDTRQARRAVSRGGSQQRQQTTVVAGEVPHIRHHQRVVDRFRRHGDAPPASIVAVGQRRQQSGVVPGRIGVTEGHDPRNVMSSQTATGIDARQTPKTIEVELTQIRHKAIWRRWDVFTTVPVSFARETVPHPVVMAKHLDGTNVRRVDVLRPRDCVTWRVFDVSDGDSEIAVEMSRRNDDQTKHHDNSGDSANHADFHPALPTHCRHLMFIRFSPTTSCPYCQLNVNLNKHWIND